MKIGYIKQTFKYPISEQMKILEPYCDKVNIEPINNSNYRSDMIQKLSVGDTLVVTRFIVLAISIQELLLFMKHLHHEGIWLYVIEQEFNTKLSHPLSYTLQLLSEFIEDIQYQKQLLGIIKAKSKGKHIGRPRKLTQQKLLKAIDMKQYHTNQEVANRLNVSRSTLLRNIAELKAG